MIPGNRPSKIKIVFQPSIFQGLYMLVSGMVFPFRSSKRQSYPPWSLWWGKIFTLTHIQKYLHSKHDHLLQPQKKVIHNFPEVEHDSPKNHPTWETIMFQFHLLNPGFHSLIFGSVTTKKWVAVKYHDPKKHQGPRAKQLLWWWGWCYWWWLPLPGISFYQQVQDFFHQQYHIHMICKCS